MRRKPMTIRRKLLASVLVLNLLSLGSLLVLALMGSHYVASYLATSVIQQTQAKVHIQVHSLFTSVSSELVRLQNGIELGLIDLDKPDELNRLLQATFEDQTQISAVMIATQTGREHLLLRLPDKWQMRRTSNLEFDGNFTFWQWETASYLYQQHQEKLDYDSRTRPWYIGAMARRKQVLSQSRVADDAKLVHWTTPYHFYTTGDPGVTASITATDDKGHVYVIAIDLALSDISRYTTQMKVGTRGMVMVLSASDEQFLSDVAVIGLPRDARFMDPAKQPQYLLKRPEELSFPVVTDAILAFSQEHNSDGATPMRFMSQAEPWWGVGRHALLGGDLNVAVAILVPESDILGEIQWVFRGVFFVFVLIFVVSIYQTIRLARRFSRPIECLVQDMKRVSRGVLDEPCRVSSDVREFALLADAHEDMRQSLQSLMKLERDIQLARMIQQKTFPDVLPNFHGYDVDAWSEPADDTGGDSYDVIGLRPSDEDGGTFIIDDDHPVKGLFLLADATGHGIGPALSVTQLRAMLRMSVWTKVLDIKTLEQINEQMMRDLPEGRFVTAWLGSLDIKKHELKTFSAGQGPLLHYHALTDAFELIEVDTPPLGVMSPLEVPEPKIINMQRGDLFVVFSDGVFEARSPSDEIFGLERVQAVIRKHAKKESHVITQAVKDAVIAYTHGVAAEDDQTVVLIKRM